MDPIEGIIELEAGCILEQANARCQEHGYEMPLDLGAKGSCQVHDTIFVQDICRS